MAFVADGRTLATAGGDSAVMLWNLSNLSALRDHTLQRACAITGGGLDHNEWDRYVPGREYVDVCKDVTRPR